jgi:hypothetical protein
VVVTAGGHAGGINSVRQVQKATGSSPRTGRCRGSS